MPMDFPNMQSLIGAAKIHKFRMPFDSESEADFRRTLADHVRDIDLIESFEIRNGVGWDKFSDSQELGIIIDGLFREKQ